MKVLFLSASAGVGHSSAANAVRAAFDEIAPETQTLLVDSYRYAAPLVSSVVSGGYLRMVTTLPQLYRFLYHRAERASEVGPLRTSAHRFTAANLRPLMLAQRPDVVVATHAFACGTMAAYKTAYADAPPVLGVITDFAAHRFWVHESIDGYVVATEAVRQELAARGVPPARVHVFGIPVHPRFAAPSEAPTALRARLQLPRHGPIVLLMGGGLGIGPFERMLRAVDRLAHPAAVVAIIGRNGRAERRARAAARGLRRSVRVLGFVPNVYDYMHAADALVTKPGGLTVAEALAARLPMLLSRPLPGQEERNSRVLVEAGCAVRVQSVRKLPSALDTVLFEPERSAGMIACAAALGRPNAAGEIAALIARFAGVSRRVA